MAPASADPPNTSLRTAQPAGQRVPPDTAADGWCYVDEPRPRPDRGRRYTTTRDQPLTSPVRKTHRQKKKCSSRGRQAGSGAGPRAAAALVWGRRSGQLTASTTKRGWCCFRVQTKKKKTRWRGRAGARGGGVAWESAAVAEACRRQRERNKWVSRHGLPRWGIPAPPTPPSQWPQGVRHKRARPQPPGHTDRRGRARSRAAPPPRLRQWRDRKSRLKTAKRQHAGGRRHHGRAGG